jgi:hypothetical protein
MSDVTALVLSIGEPYTERALASVKCQTVAATETIVVRGAVPFHAALNQGVTQVRTPFFIQVDADMILDTRCVESLRAAMAPTVGYVVGLLRDPLLGRIVGVKLYRTACLRETPFPGSVSPDTDALKTLRAGGWAVAHALCWDSRHTFGRHEPDYTLPYTYAKFLVTGVRHHYRRNGRATRGLFRQLCQSEHPLAPLAMAAVAHGLFVDLSGDLLDASRRWHLPPVLRDFDTAPASIPRPEPVQRTGLAPLETLFVRAYHSGRARSGAAAEVVRVEHARLRAEWGVPAWVSAVGFFHGLLCEAGDPPDAERAFARFAILLSDADRVVQ